MPSRALVRWQTEQKAKLDQIEAAHKAVGGTGPGRRYLTQLNHAYLVMLAAQWQDFCRNLHTEAADAIASVIQPPTARLALQAALTLGRSLDRGNAGPNTIGTDFGRFGATKFWDLVDLQDKRNATRRMRLEQLNTWRNAVAHQDFNWSKEELKLIVGTRGTLDDVRMWRDACNALAQEFDRTVAGQAMNLIGKQPW
jgi:hypothetical protein